MQYLCTLRRARCIRTKMLVAELLLERLCMLSSLAHAIGLAGGIPESCEYVSNQDFLVSQVDLALPLI